MKTRNSTFLLLLLIFLALAKRHKEGYVGTCTQTLNSCAFCCLFPQNLHTQSKSSQAAIQQRALLLQAREDLELKLLDFLEEHQSSLAHDTTFQLLDGHGHAEVGGLNTHVTITNAHV